MAVRGYLAGALHDSGSQAKGDGPSTRLTRIYARTRRQAMDWSLVLASQGVAATILRDPGEGWCLEVSSHDGQNALQAIRQYHVENRGWRWPEAVRWPRSAFRWESLAWAATLMLLFWWSNADVTRHNAGIMDSTAVSSGQWWRVFTAISLHADPAHLISNLTAGILLLGFAMGRFGVGTALLTSFLAGAAGNLLSLQLNAKPFHGLGASGMVMGALGLIAAQSLRPARPMPLKPRLAAFAAGLMLFVLYGVAPESDIPAHLGGFFAGLILGTLLLLLPSRWPRLRTINLAALIILLSLLVVTWRLALTTGRFF